MKAFKKIIHRLISSPLKWAFPIVGLLALMWFLIRVIPKPSRAAYPCQRIAFPIASQFVIWLCVGLGSLAIVKRVKRIAILWSSVAVKKLKRTITII